MNSGLRSGLALPRAERPQEHPRSPGDPIELGIARANKTLRNVRRGLSKEQHVRMSADAVTEHKVNMTVTFIIDD